MAAHVIGNDNRANLGKVLPHYVQCASADYEVILVNSDEELWDVFIQVNELATKQNAGTFD
jgi:hypothetical protein